MIRFSQELSDEYEKSDHITSFDNLHTFDDPSCYKDDSLDKHTLVNDCKAFEKEYFYNLQEDNDPTEQKHLNLINNIENNIGSLKISRIYFANFFIQDADKHENPHREKILSKLNIIAKREYNWDDNMSSGTNVKSLNYAKIILVEILKSVTKIYEWIEPYISSDEYGDITARWRNGIKDLHVFISENEIGYLKVWGPNMNDEMETGTVVKGEYLELWKWLVNEKIN